MLSLCSYLIIFTLFLELNFKYKFLIVTITLFFILLTTNKRIHLKHTHAFIKCLIVYKLIMVSGFIAIYARYIPLASSHLYHTTLSFPHFILITITTQLVTNRYILPRTYSLPRKPRFHLSIKPHRG